MNRFSKELLPVLKVCSIALLVAGGLGWNEAAAQDGEKLFKANCASCHKVDQNLTGPALKGTRERWAGREELLYLWIKNPNAAIATGDAYIRGLLQEWQPRSGIMAAQAVNDAEITAILDYIDNWTPPAPLTPGPGVEVPVAAPDGGLSTTWLLIVLFILLILVFSLWGVRSSLGKLNSTIREAQGLEAEPEISFGERSRQWLWENKVLVSIAGILVFVYLVTLGWDALLGVGVYTGYTPDQPIKFNHTLHAGENGIACVYCHHSATKSKHAGIPSVNICMNCHKGINQGRSEEGTKEIQKIYAAVGWDPDKMAYTGEENPIQWIKVHNLPDHAYFNHAQHYTVAQIECQECHGQIQAEYTVAGQYSPLTMGWCINCHNQTEVKMEGNGYYDEVHRRLADHNKEELKKYLEDGIITARELGGWECAKCHY
jgi:mono/diheme cytochrome c family protein